MIVMARPLNSYREERYLTVDEFAKHLGVSLHTLYKALRGERLRVTTVRRIAEKLGVHPSEIAEFERKPKE
jgi:predicted transcriptional regulator